NGSSVAKTFLARGRRVMLWDVDEHRARATADELGADVASSREEALAAHVVATVTPGHEIVFVEGSLQPGQAGSLMGADGRGKAEIAIDELVHTRVFCDDWAQASHNGDLVHAVEAGRITREDVAQLGDVLSGSAPGRQSPGDITSFDSTGLAIQDLAIALAAMEHAGELSLPTIELGS